MTPLLEDWNFEKIENYNPQIGYQQSKTANVLFSIKLDELGKNMELEVLPSTLV